MITKKPEPQLQKPDAKANEFAARYAALCQEYGLQIQPQVFFKQQIDDTFTIGAQLAVVPAQANA